MTESHRPILTCAQCDAPVKEHHRFCHNCGAYLRADIDSVSIFNNGGLLLLSKKPVAIVYDDILR